VLAVMTIDQRGSRGDIDRVDHLIAELRRDVTSNPVLAFERTAGDEIQGVLSEPELVVELSLRCMRAAHWAIGIGLGSIRTPIPDSTRKATGSAFEHARDAVNSAKSALEAVAVRGPNPGASRYAEAVFATLATLLRRRSAAGWQAVDLIGAGRTQTEIGEILGISKQAVSQRLTAAAWWQEQGLRPVAAHLLTEAA